MTLPRADTRVTYPSGATTANTVVTHVEAFSGGTAVLVETSCVHPVDPAWPDQGPDRAVLRGTGNEWPLLDCVVGATDGMTLWVGSDVPVRKGTDGWAFVVVHVLPADAVIAEGDKVTLDVDATYRDALSVGHTACHLASLALNRALVGAWRKEPRKDALGAPDFDAVACAVSTIQERGARDEYRVGRSVRRLGFEAEALNDLDEVERLVNQTLLTWTASGAQVRIETEGDGLTDRRYWVCDLAEGEARIPCGVTHASGLHELGATSVRLERTEAEGAIGFVMHTTAVR